MLDLSAVAGDSAGSGLLLLPILIPTLGTVVAAGLMALVAWLGNRRNNRREDVDSSVGRMDKVAGRQEAEITRLTVDRDYWRTRALKGEAERDEQRDLNDHLVAECARKHRP